MTTDLTIIRTLAPENFLSMSPADQMRELGTMYKYGMNARIEAMNTGLMAVHDAWCSFTSEIKRQQTALLQAHPELVMLAAR